MNIFDFYAMSKKTTEATNAVMWVASCLAIGYTVYVTKNPKALWALLIPMLAQRGAAPNLKQTTTTETTSENKPDNDISDEEEN